MTIWLKMVVCCMKGNVIAVNLCRAKVEEYIEANYRIVGKINFSATVMTPGAAIIYLIYGIPLWNQNQPAQIVMAYGKLMSLETLGGQAA
jgi:hypothetical protein